MIDNYLEPSKSKFLVSGCQLFDKVRIGAIVADFLDDGSDVLIEVSCDFHDLLLLVRRYV
jgi:hypothetical protein